MATSPKLKQISYSDAVRLLNDPDVQDDLVDAFARLGQAMSATMDRFEAISKQMHSIDMRLRSTFRAKWENMREELSQIMWQFRTNASMISGRLKLFCNTVLPMAARNVDRTPSRNRSLVESIQVLQSFSSLSVEHANATRTVLDRTVRLSRGMISFLIDFMRATTRHTTCGVEEMAKLSQKITELQLVVQQVFTSTAELKETNIIHILYVCSRFVSSSGRNGRSRIRRPIVLEHDLADLGQVYDTFDQKRNEMAHAQYTAQLRQNRSDPVTIVQNTLFSFVQELVLMTESGLTSSLATWGRLRVDSGHLYKWMNTPADKVSIPPIIVAYLEAKTTAYVPLTRGLDAYVNAIDPSPYFNNEYGSDASSRGSP